MRTLLKLLHCRRHVIGPFPAWLVAATLAMQPVSAAPATECIVTPRPASEFVVPTDPAPAGRSMRIIEDWDQLPAGTPATAEEASAAQAFAELYTACQNTGDFRLLAALYTDAMLQGDLANLLPLPFQPQNPLEALYALLFDPNGKDAAEASAQLAQDLAAPPTPLSPPIAAAEVRDVRVLPDGRLGAVLMQDSRPTEFQIYVRVDGRLLLDERMDFR